jgi:hypothetical protein
MFNIYSFLIGALAVFVISTLVYIIGESSLFPNYDGEDLLLVFTQFWWTIPFSILTFLWKHRLIQVVSSAQFDNILKAEKYYTEKRQNFSFKIKRLSNNLYTVRAFSDPIKHPILHHLRIIIIVKKNNKKVVDGMK